ncbi:hypothetical protein OF83DRAFT_1062076 [Amylostereum chailletii]|nr:hypothetical protein OF83DRAFT_1062076 [Amylostereum chailletii]
MKLTRLGALFMSFAFAVIGGSVGLNALIDGNRSKSTLRRLLPNTVSVNFNINAPAPATDVFKSGVVLTTVCALIALLTLLLLLATALSGRRAGSARTPLMTRTLPLQAGVLAFCAVWLFATVIPFTDFFANRSVKVNASVGGVPLPQSAINSLTSQLGLSQRYKDFHYLRLVAILPWFTVLFTGIAAAVLFVAARHRATAVKDNSSISKEKPVDA